MTKQCSSCGGFCGNVCQRENVAQPEQEPEWYHGVDEHGCNRFYHKTEVRPSEFKTPLYTTPPQRTWVGLTDDEVVSLKMLGRDLEFVSMTALRRFARDIEQTLKEKNQ